MAKRADDLMASVCTLPLGESHVLTRP
jgi:hypothetical protein